MSKHFKTLCLILAILLISTGCNSGQSDITNTPDISIEIPESPEATDSENPENIESTDPVILKLSVAEQAMGMDFMDYYEDFRSLIKEKFNIELAVSFGGQYNYVDDQMLQKNDIFFLNSGIHYERRMMMDADMIIPFSDYLQDSKTWSEMPDSFKQAHMDGEGNVWAIAYNDNPNVWVRTIRKDWLIKTGLKIPSTVDELYNLLQAFTYNDPDGNSINDTYGTGLSDEEIRLMAFKDIFEANGCYLAYHNTWRDRRGWDVEYSMMGYNPNTGLIEDNLKNPGFMQSLETIHSIIDNKMIDLQPDSLIDGIMSNDSVGTHMGILNDNLVYPAKYEYCYSLEGTQTKNTATVLYGDQNLYYLSKYSRDPETAVPAFIDMMFGSAESYKLMRYGPLGEDELYSEDNGVIIKNNVNERLTSHIELIGDISWLKNKISTTEALPTGIERLDVESLMKDDNMLPLSHIHMSILEYSITHDRSGELALLKFYLREISDASEAFLNGKVSASDFYDELVEIHIRYDVDDWLDDVNQRWLGMN